MSSEVEIESIPGLPHDLPPGETVLWQGRPDWRALARHTFKVRALAAYFALFGAARFVVAVEERQGAAGARQLMIVAALAAGCIGVLTVMAWLNARSTIYTLTTRRIVMRIGVALPMTWNLPFKRIASAQVKARREGDGDIVLELKAPDRIAWLQLWPHAQPWHLMRARPTLRTIAEPARVAALIAEAVKGWAGESAAPVWVTDPGSYAPSDTTKPAPASLGGHSEVATEASH